MSYVAVSAQVHDSAEVGAGTAVWDLAQIREHAVVGRECVVGRGTYIGPGVQVGDRTKIQNQALVYDPAVLEDGVFVGPGAILTNDQHPRAVTPDMEVKSAMDWTPVGVTVCQGASIGAGAVCVAPVTVGRWAVVGANSTVVADVADFAMVVGAPARRIGWVGHAGRRLQSRDHTSWCCPETGRRYVEVDGALREESSHV